MEIPKDPIREPPPPAGGVFRPNWEVRDNENVLASEAAAFRFAEGFLNKPTIDFLASMGEVSLKRQLASSQFQSFALAWEESRHRELATFVAHGSDTLQRQLQATIADQQDTIKRFSRTAAQLERQIVIKDADNVELERENMTLRNRLDRARKESASQGIELKARDEEIRSLKAQLQSLQEQLQASSSDGEEEDEEDQDGGRDVADGGNKG